MQQRNGKTAYLQLAAILALTSFVYGCSSGSSDADADSQNPVNNSSESNGNTANAIGRTESSAIGNVFAFGAANRTLYTFANDADNVSNCTGGCLENWPIVEATSAKISGPFATIERDDGRFQWTFKKRPVYYYVGDAAAGEINGEGLGGVWWVARPDPISTGSTNLGTVLMGAGSISDGVNAATRSDIDGRTLYTFQNDSLNSSACDGGCAANWPPLYADSGALPADGYTLITRSDGTMQWAQAGQALYLYQGDAVAGDTNGNGVGGVWDVAVPSN